MSGENADRVKALVLSCLTPSGPLANLPDDCDLVGEGIIDSLGFIMLISAVETEIGVEIDFYGMDPERLTVFGPLCRYIADAQQKAITS
jgi:acyl carrier protein